MTSAQYSVSFCRMTFCTVSVVGNKGHIHLEDYMIVIAADMILQSNLEKATLALKGQSVAFQLPYHDI